MTVRWMAALSVMMVSAAAYASSNEQPIKGADGVTVAVLANCNDCQSGESATCHSGAEQGWLNGKPCGKCLLDANYGVTLKYPYDVHIVGNLVDPEGKPVKDRFVKAFLPNGWTIRGRTAEQGKFRLMLGATAERQSKEPVVVNLGQHVDTKKGDDQFYSVFILPESYKPCDAAATKSAHTRPGAHPKAKGKKQ